MSASHANAEHGSNPRVDALIYEITPGVASSRIYEGPNDSMANSETPAGEVLVEPQPEPGDPYNDPNQPPYDD